MKESNAPPRIVWMLILFLVTFASWFGAPNMGISQTSTPSEHRPSRDGSYWGKFPIGPTICPTPGDYTDPKCRRIAENEHVTIGGEVVHSSGVPFLTAILDDGTRGYVMTSQAALMLTSEDPAAARKWAEDEKRRLIAAQKAERENARKAEQAAIEDAKKAAENAKKAAAECSARGGIAIGMTASQVLSSCWGAPNHKNITMTASGSREQWIYSEGYVYFTDGIVTAIQTMQ